MLIDDHYGAWVGPDLVPLFIEESTLSNNALYNTL